MIITVTSGGPDWASIMTAFGTVAAAVAAVGIALWVDWRSGVRIRAEHDRGDRLLAAEQARSRAAIEEERRLARERGSRWNGLDVIYASAAGVSQVRAAAKPGFHVGSPGITMGL